MFSRSFVSVSGRLRFPVRTARVSQQRRQLMDAHTRPSHSGMISRDGGAHQANHHPSPPKSGEIDWSTIATRAILAAGMVHVFTTYGLDFTLCEGPSMSPTLQSSGEIIVFEKYFFRRRFEYCGEKRAADAVEKQGSDEIWHEKLISVSDMPRYSWTEALQHWMAPLSVGDVVVVQHPSRKGTVCKRVRGLPGDSVLIADLRASGVPRGKHQRRQLQLIPDGHVWLEGDNPANSSDSRAYGPIPAALITGKVIARIWPLRGDAWMKRGGPPRHEYPHAATASTILPAGYAGQTIAGSEEEEERNDDEDGTEKEN